MLTMLADFRTEPYILDKREWDNCQLSAIFEIHVLFKAFKHQAFPKLSSYRWGPESQVPLSTLTCLLCNMLSVLAVWNSWYFLSQFVPPLCMKHILLTADRSLVVDSMKRQKYLRAGLSGMWLLLYLGALLPLSPWDNTCTLTNEFSRL